MTDPRTWSRRTLLFMRLLVGLVVPAVLSACGSDYQTPSCPAGEVLIDGVCVPAE